MMTGIERLRAFQEEKRRNALKTTINKAYGVLSDADKEVIMRPSSEETDIRKKGFPELSPSLACLYLQMCIPLMTREVAADFTQNLIFHDTQ